jgi:hypothetical protein
VQIYNLQAKSGLIFNLLFFLFGWSMNLTNTFLKILHKPNERIYLNFGVDLGFWPEMPGNYLWIRELNRELNDFHEFSHPKQNGLI